LVSGAGFVASGDRKMDAPFKKPRKSTILLVKKASKGRFLMPKKILNAQISILWRKGLRMRYFRMRRRIMV
jgi:hypothetical protein